MSTPFLKSEESSTLGTIYYRSVLPGVSVEMGLEARVAGLKPKTGGRESCLCSYWRCLRVRAWWLFEAAVPRPQGHARGEGGA